MNNKLEELKDEDIINLLFDEIKLDDKERLFYSKDKMKIISIVKNSINSYSIVYMKMTIADEEERSLLNKYGWWELKFPSKIASYYETIEDALNDIQNELNDYIQLK